MSVLRPAVGPNRRGALLALAGATTLVPKAPAARPTPDHMQAGRYEPGQSVAGFLVSEKLDGVRGRWDGHSLWTRSGRLITSPEAFRSAWPDMALDGELWAGRGRFLQAVAAVRDGPDSPAWQGMRFMVFDAPFLPGAFGLPGGRLEIFSEAVRHAGSPTLMALEQVQAPHPEALAARLQALSAEGGEGLMLHRAKALYQPGRSSDLLKYKPFDDAYAQVVQALPGKGRFKGMAGALLVQTLEGHRLRLGTGLGDALRRDPPAPGSWVSYRFQGRHPGGLPRFASFLRVVPDVEL